MSEIKLRELSLQLCESLGPGYQNTPGRRSQPPRITAQRLEAALDFTGAPPRAATATRRPNASAPSPIHPLGGHVSSPGRGPQPSASRNKEQQRAASTDGQPVRGQALRRRASDPLISVTNPDAKTLPGYTGSTQIAYQVKGSMRTLIQTPRKAESIAYMLLADQVNKGQAVSVNPAEKIERLADVNSILQQNGVETESYTTLETMKEQVSSGGYSAVIEVVNPEENRTEFLIVDGFEDGSAYTRQTNTRAQRFEEHLIDALLQQDDGASAPKCLLVKN